MPAQHDPTLLQIGRIIRKIREDQGLSRESVADAAEIGLRHLAAIELEEKNASIYTLYRIIHALGISADQVFYPELYEDDSPLTHTIRLLTNCSPTQVRLVDGFIRLLLDQEESAQ